MNSKLYGCDARVLRLFIGGYRLFCYWLKQMAEHSHWFCMEPAMRLQCYATHNTMWIKKKKKVLYGSSIIARNLRSNKKKNLLNSAIYI